MFIKRLFRDPKQNVRSITYLHTGERVRGLKRDPKEMLKNPEGLHYDDFDLAKNQDLVCDAFRLRQNELKLPGKLVLQCLTHKSFAQGSKPYNEKLSLLGFHFLKYCASIMSLEQPVLMDKGRKNIQNPINGLNFANLGTHSAKNIISKEVIGELVRLKGIDSLIFWNKRSTLESAKFNGQDTVRTSVLNALIGGTLIFNGYEKTAAYVNSELLNPKNEQSLVFLSKRLEM